MLGFISTPVVVVVVVVLLLTVCVCVCGHVGSIAWCGILC